MNHPEIDQLADDFWAMCGGPPPAPRDLEPHLSLVAPLFVVSIRSLNADAARDWLLKIGIDLPNRSWPQTSLHGCLIAYRGRGAIFVESDLEPAERRVIVAHEYAHFEWDYLQLRRAAVRRLGAGILPILDGTKTPNEIEELAVVLAGVPLGMHTHFFDFDRDREDWASRYALELLTPRHAVAGLPLRDLVETWGLPERWAVAYHSILAQPARDFASNFGL